MAMKKSDMEDHRSAYQDLMSRSRLAEREGLYRNAVDLALSSWEHIDGMMQYKRRYENEDFSSIHAIELVLKYAPLLLDFQKLDMLEQLLKNYRRIEKNTSDSLGDKLSEARERLWENHRLWDYLEQNPDTRQDGLRRILRGNQDQWRATAEAWEKMGLLHRKPEGGSYRLALSTRMGEVVSAKCPSCGEVTEAPKAMLLEETACTGCRAKVLFVILATEIVDDKKE